MSETVTVKIEINGVVYPVSCMTGEENRLIESSKEVNKVIASLSNVSETIGETRLLAITSFTSCPRKRILSTPSLVYMSTHLSY